MKPHRSEYPTVLMKAKISTHNDKGDCYTDLHVHLGATSSPHYLWELAHRQGINLENKNYWDFVDNMLVPSHIDHEKYLRRFDLTQLIGSSPDAVAQTVFNAFSEAYRKSNITLMEIRFNPMLRNISGKYDLDNLILKACSAVKKAMLVYPIVGGIIIETDRKFSAEQSMILAHKAVEFKNMGVVGFDISGSYYKDPTFNFDPHIKAFEYVKKNGLGVTVHAGELPDTEYEIKDVLDKIQPDRIGHGIHCVEDDTIMDAIKERGISLEVCPSSNVTTSAVESKGHMFKIINRLLEYDVKFTINSDGPEFLRSYTKDEFDKHIRLHELISNSDIYKIRMNGFTESFLCKYGGYGLDQCIGRP